MNKKTVGIVGFVVLVLLAWFFVGKENVTVISSNRSVEGNFAIGAGENIVLANSAALSINGNLNAVGSLKCKDGPAVVHVSGNATIEGELTCMRDEEADDAGTGIQIVVGGSVTFGKNAKIASNGHVQIVSDEKYLLTSSEQFDTAFDEAARDTGAGTRIGPFVPENPTQGISSAQSRGAVVVVSPQAGVPFEFIKTAHAQPLDKDGNVVPNVVLSGTWRIGNGGGPPSGLDIPTPPKKVNKILLNFNFGDNGNVALRDFYLAGPNGRDGESDEGASCNARGEKGEDAFRMRVYAQDITLDNFTLQLGNGGAGGVAETKTDCDPGIAKGGDGGEAGNFKMTALGKIEIASFRIIPGTGGNGGDATASGKDGVDGCAGSKGGDATATAGVGGKNKKELSALGAVSGISNVTVDRVDGGWGGKAIAKPGKGGNGTGCNCNGGKGGDGTATGGKGGDASVSIVGGTGEAHGGNGGNADSRGAAGGNGGSCEFKPLGGNGGKGGNATSKSGAGGTGTSGNGEDGSVIDETGGNGGNGGDGCGPGKGGKGGSGDPNGADGSDGKRVCPEVKKETPATAIPSGGANTVPDSSVGGVVKIRAIQYNGKYLPVDQLIVENEAGCGTEHWHAAQGVVKATDGTFVSDPGPQCGYGKVREKPAMEVLAPNPS